MIVKLVTAKASCIDWAHFCSRLLLLLSEALKMGWTDRAGNVPVRLVESLEIHKLEHEAETLLIHLSTDNVYDGGRSFYKETSPCEPVNCYGVSKKDAELLIQVGKFFPSRHCLTGFWLANILVKNNQVQLSTSQE